MKAEHPALPENFCNTTELTMPVGIVRKSGKVSISPPFSYDRQGSESSD
jgi:hypothetical protein